MGGSKFLIISVFLSVLIVGGAVFFVWYNSLPSNSVDILGSGEPGKIAIPQSLTQCDTQDKCIIVDRSCGFCCDFIAINSRHEGLYNQMFDTSCQSYKENYCNCHDLKHYPACVKGRCEMLEWQE